MQYRGLAFLAGGDKGLEGHITIPSNKKFANSDIFLDILKKYNPNLFGQSYGIGAAAEFDVAYLNIAQPGAVASDLAGQAQILVDRVLSHPEVQPLHKSYFLAF